MPQVTVSFSLKFQGKNGDENFDFRFMGKTWHFRNIGTAPRSLTFYKTGDLDDMQLWFHNSGSGTHRRCQRGDNRRCRTRRRWGRRRRRCTGGPWTNCTNHPWQRTLIIHHFKVNQTDCKNMLARRVTTCDPRSGNVTKKYNVPNGLVTHSGHYTVSAQELEQYASIPMVPASDYHKAEQGRHVAVQSRDKTQGMYSNLLEDHSELETKYNELLSRFGVNEDMLSDLNKKQKIAVQRGVALAIANGTKDEQITQLQGIQAETQLALNAALQKIINEKSKIYQDIEKENTNLIKENKDRSQTNTTFQQKTLYQSESAKKFIRYNDFMFYVYYVLLAGTILIIFYTDGKNTKQFYQNIHYTIAFIILLLLYPIYIFDLELYLLKLFNYIMSFLTSKLYNDQVY